MAFGQPSRFCSNDLQPIHSNSLFLKKNVVIFLLCWNPFSGLSLVLESRPKISARLRRPCMTSLLPVSLELLALLTHKLSNSSHNVPPSFGFRDCQPEPFLPRVHSSSHSFLPGTPFLAIWRPIPPTHWDIRLDSTCSKRPCWITTFPHSLNPHHHAFLITLFWNRQGL